MYLYIARGEREARLEQPARFPEDGLDERRGERRFLLEGLRLTENAPDELWARFGDAPGLIGETHGAYAFAMLDEAGATVGHDLLGKRSLYYYAEGGALACGTSFFALADALRARGARLTADEAAVAAMCRDGVFAGDQTYVNEIKFLPPYQYLTYRDGQTDARALPLPQKRAGATAAEAIERLDALFTEGCALQYRKNQRFGYPQTATLSAGMDSRMTLRCLLALMRDDGATPDALTTLTYAQSGSMDDTIAAKISADMGCKHVFHALDGGGFLLERDAILAENEGQMGYGGSTGAYDTFSGREGLGVVHTGLGGGEIMGDILLADAPDAVGDARSLGDMRVCLNFQKTTHRFCEACSPFLYEPFYEYALSLPTEMKLGRGLYAAWYWQKVGWAYPTTYYRGPVGSRADKLAGGAMLRLMTKLGRKSRFDMNPFAAWYRENPAIGAYLADTLAADLAALNGVLAGGAPETIREAFATGGPEQKAQAITASGALKRLFV